MSKKTITIIGATGHIGHHLTEELLKKGFTVRAIGRNQEKLQLLKKKGAETISINIDNAQELTKALTGSDAVFSFIPPGKDTQDMSVNQDKIGEAITKAIQQSNVKYVINLSSIGANLSKGTGPILGLHRQEERLNNLKDVNVLHLRPGYFMENFFLSIPAIKGLGSSISSLNGDVSIAMIATRDIAHKAAEQFEKLDFQGKTIFELVGPKEITLNEAIKILGKAIGKPDLQHRDITPDQFEKLLTQHGYSEKNAKYYSEMYTAFNDQVIKPTQNITKEHRGTTTIEEFSREFANAYNNPELAVAGR